jgi:hypothetical protein
MSGLDPLYYNDNFRLFFQHKLWWWFIFLRSLTFGYCGAAAPLLFRQRKSGPDSAHLKVLDRWLALLAVASFVIWWLVFRDIHKFLGFHLPSKRYRCAIYITSAATIIPSFFLHIQIAFLTSKTTSPVDSGLTRRGILLFLAASGLYLWMVHRFLLNDNEEHYEPIIYLLGNCTASTSSSEGQSVSAVAALEPYSDSPPSSDESRLSSEGHLFKAYTTQRISDPLPTCELDEHLHAQGSGVTETELTPEPRDSSAPNPSESTTPGSTDNQPTSPLRCRTVARFDYMCQSRIGPHSWLSYPLTLVILGIYSTILFGLVANLIYKNRFLIFSSPYVRHTASRI